MTAELSKYVEMLREGGATIARVISPASIITAPWPVMKCRYGCPRFGHNRSCPPFAPAWEEMRAILDSFSEAIIFSVPDMSVGTPLAVKVAREASRDGFYKALAFGTGPCTLCEECRVGECPRPYDTAPSMEACGVDVFGTVRALGLPLETSPAPGAALNCYGLILVH